MFSLLPSELRQLILSYLSRREYKAIVPYKNLLLCKSYLSMEDFCKTKVIPLILLSDQEKEQLFLNGCKYDNLILTKWLLKQSIDFSINYNSAILLASEYGHKKIVEFMIVELGIDPSCNNNCIIRSASKNGHKKW